MQAVGKSWHRLPDGLGTLTNHRHQQSWALTKLDPNSLTTSSSTPSSRRKSTSTSLVSRHTFQISQDVRPFGRVKGTERKLKKCNDRQLANTTLIGAHQQDHRDLPHCHPLVRLSTFNHILEEGTGWLTLHAADTFPSFSISVRCQIQEPKGQRWTTTNWFPTGYTRSEPRPPVIRYVF